ncbi:MAG: hypothetical protein LBF84_02640 [Holosporales bacterium]|jgi:hypothetical protein|nr:hypothetical protein [Holosporales bacterium]
MIDQYKGLEIGEDGRIVWIPLAPFPDTGDRSEGTFAPNWMIYIENAGTASKIEGSVEDSGKNLTEYTYLFGWFCEAERKVLGGAGVNLFTSSILWYSVIYFVMPNGEHSAFIRNAVHGGVIIPTINFVRLSRIDNRVVVIQSITLSTCHPYSYHSLHDYTVFAVTFIVRNNLVYGYKQDGTLEGQNICNVDLSSNVVT